MGREGEGRVGNIEVILASARGGDSSAGVFKSVDALTRAIKEKV